MLSAGKILLIIKSTHSHTHTKSSQHSTLVGKNQFFLLLLVVVFRFKANRHSDGAGQEERERGVDLLGVFGEECRMCERRI